eukprot:scaffold1124_cov131-Isochrysis_galbana.AAC.12
MSRGEGEKGEGCRIRGAAKYSTITVTDVQSDGRPRAVPRDSHGALRLRDAAAAARFHGLHVRICPAVRRRRGLWLKSEPEREQAVRSAAKLFVSICESQAPFVAVENPKMHSLATDLVGGRKPTQYVQPYEHGTGHQKATGLYPTYNLPLIQPTCIMAERTSAMADLPRSPQSDVYWYRGSNGPTVDAYSSRIL